MPTPVGKLARRIAESLTVVAGFARIQIAGDSLDSCESSYNGETGFTVLQGNLTIGPKSLAQDGLFRHPCAGNSTLGGGLPELMKMFLLVF
jgi:hypothetical protein